MFTRGYDKKFLDKIEANPKLSRISRTAARDIKKSTKKLKEEYKERFDMKKDKAAKERMKRELVMIQEGAIQRATDKVHKMSKSRMYHAEAVTLPDGRLKIQAKGRINPKITKQLARVERQTVRDEKAAARALERAKEKERKAAMQHEDEAEPDLNELFFIYEEDEDGAYDLVDPFDEVEHADLDEELAHYGIKGMKWGVRRKDYVKKSTGSKPNNTTPKKSNVDPKVLTKKPNNAGKSATIVTTTTTQKKIQGPPDRQKPAVTAEIKTDNIPVRTKLTPANPRRLSDQDLSTAIKRLQMEKQYRELSAPEISAGRKILTDILVTSGKTVATQYVTHFMGKGVAQLTKVDLGKGKKKD